MAIHQGLEGIPALSSPVRLAMTITFETLFDLMAKRAPSLKPLTPFTRIRYDSPPGVE